MPASSGIRTRSPDRSLRATSSRFVAVSQSRSRLTSPMCGPHMHGPHVLILAPRDDTVDVPANQAVHIDERVAIHDDSAHGLTRGAQMTSRYIGDVEANSVHPA